MIVLYTSALIPTDFESRLFDYQKSYNLLRNYFHENEIHILECYSDHWKIIEVNSNCVFISNTHNPNLKNKGVLEFECINKFLLNTKIKDEYILKITGRYQLLSDNLILNCKKNIGYDFYGKLVDNGSQVFTGCFIIKNSVLKEFIEQIDFDYLEKKMINIEKHLKDFLTENEKNCFYVSDIDLFAPIFGCGNVQNVFL